jgi:hypothetical protein
MDEGSFAWDEALAPRLQAVLRTLLETTLA